MSTARKPLVAGNWKMNGLVAQLSELKTLVENADRFAASVELMICPPATIIAAAAKVAAQGPVAIGAQDCHANDKGAHTGDLSAEMLADAGASAVIVGHSERRADHGETDGLVASKAGAAYRAGLTAIICVGETEAERDAGRTIEVVTSQLAGSLPENADAANTVVAYEPVWAIGTGRTPTVDDVAAVHAAIRAKLVELVGAEAGDAVRILYGGSVKPSNAAELMAVADVDGALVGGASLKAADFLAIAGVYA